MSLEQALIYHVDDTTHLVSYFALIGLLVWAQFKFGLLKGLVVPAFLFITGDAFFAVSVSTLYGVKYLDSIWLIVLPLPLVFWFAYLHLPVPWFYLGATAVSFAFFVLDGGKVSYGYAGSGLLYLQNFEVNAREILTYVGCCLGLAYDLRGVKNIALKVTIFRPRVQA